MRIGIFDSGLGGLTVLQAVRRMRPGLECIYLGDTARTPYGSKSRATVLRYARECADFLRQFEIDLLVVACNTASSLALEELRAECPCPVIGTIEPAVQACLHGSESGPVAVIGTRATIASGIYAARIRALRPETEVFSQPCPLFVPLVEEGFFSGEIVERVIELYLAELRDRRIRSLILACTHYPMLRNAIGGFLGPDVRVVECSEAIADEVARMEDIAVKPAEAPGKVRYFVTDEVSKFNALASLLLNGDAVQAVKVESLAAERVIAN